MKLFPTKFNGYYVSEDGKIWVEFNRYTGKKDVLREVNQHPRGGVKNDRYMSVNISIKDADGKTIKQILHYTHRLIAETLISNPNNYKEIDHIDGDKLNNHVSNLEWCNRLHNMRWTTQKNAKYFKITDIITNNTYEGVNLHKFVRENWEWISKRTKITDIGKYTRNLLGKYKINSHVNGFILER